MAAIAYDVPRPYSTTSEKTFPRGFGTPSGTFYEGDFVVLTVGVLALCSSNFLTVSGLADMNSYAQFTSLSSDSPTRGPFGALNQLGTTVQPFAPGAVGHFIKAKGQLFEVSLVQSFLATYPSNAQTVGLCVDSVSGLWVASTTASVNATIIQLLPIPGGGAVGDTGARVLIRFNEGVGNGTVVGN